MGILDALMTMIYDSVTIIMTRSGRGQSHYVYIEEVVRLTAICNANDSPYN